MVPDPKVALLVNREIGGRNPSYLAGIPVVSEELAKLRCGVIQRVWKVWQSILHHTHFTWWPGARQILRIAWILSLFPTTRTNVVKRTARAVSYA